MEFFLWNGCVCFLSPFWPLFPDPHADRQDAALFYGQDGGGGRRGSVAAAEEAVGPSSGGPVP